MCSRFVFRCFRALERFGDRVTGAAGPFFVALAVILLSLGIVCFFTVIQPALTWLSIPLNVLIAINLLFHYYCACRTPPGFVEDPPRQSGTGLLWATPKKARSPTTSGVQWSSHERITKAELTRCRKCGIARPERAHHCRVCNRCILKYDHHCPVRVNQCVGLYNERHFVLFLAYLVLSTFCISVLGYDKMLIATGYLWTEIWEYTYPAVLYMLIYILSVVLCFAVFIMLSWHVWTVMLGETSVESHDHELYKSIAKDRGEVFQNSYDLGKRKNLELFFNVGPNRYPYYTLLLPLRIMPYTDGRSWARREGLDRHAGVIPGEELTDDEES